MMANQENENVVTPYSRKKVSLKYIAMAIIILILSFAIAFFVGKSLFGAPNDKDEQNIEIGPLYNTPEFTVNIANSNGRRFLMTQFSLEVDKKKVLKELDKKLPIIQDKAIIVLSVQTVEDLNSIDGKEKIKQLLIDNFNNILTEGKVINIFFNKFVYQ